MARAIRFFVTTAVGLVLVMPHSGCSSNVNDAGVAGTKGEAPADAPKSQEEFFQKQNELTKKPTKPAAADKKAAK